MAIKILDVGQCGFDGPRMAALWRDRLGATVDRVANGKDAVERLKNGDYDVVLVNRVLAADGSSGLDVIEDLLSANTSVPVMLVSDLTDAQDAAVALGAFRGFGKADLGEPATLELVASVTVGQDGRER
ncbi:MAG TPA: response regulator [Pirellulales bacterium]|jgi:CheY-like chemotaxis protein|nr:response regulator [Pirellulales bacterium]